MQTAIVSESAIIKCGPPNDASTHACDALNQRVRANFTGREIGILFGTGTPVPDYRNVDFERLRKRYLAVMQQYVAQQNTAKQRIVGK